MGLAVMAIAVLDLVRWLDWRRKELLTYVAPDRASDGDEINLHEPAAGRTGHRMHSEAHFGLLQSSDFMRFGSRCKTPLGAAQATCEYASSAFIFKQRLCSQRRWV